MDDKKEKEPFETKIEREIGPTSSENLTALRKAYNRAKMRVAHTATDGDSSREWSGNENLYNWHIAEIKRLQELPAPHLIRDFVCLAKDYDYYHFHNIISTKCFQELIYSPPGLHHALLVFHEKGIDEKPFIDYLCEKQLDLLKKIVADSDFQRFENTFPVTAAKLRTKAGIPKPTAEETKESKTHAKSPQIKADQLTLALRYIYTHIFPYISKDNKIKLNKHITNTYPEISEIDFSKNTEFFVLAEQQKLSLINKLLNKWEQIKNWRNAAFISLLIFTSLAIVSSFFPPLIKIPLSSLGKPGILVFSGALLAAITFIGHLFHLYKTELKATAHNRLGGDPNYQPDKVAFHVRFLAKWRGLSFWWKFAAAAAIIIGITSILFGKFPELLAILPTAKNVPLANILTYSGAGLVSFTTVAHAAHIHWLQPEPAAEYSSLTEEYFNPKNVIQKALERNPPQTEPVSVAQEPSTLAVTQAWDEPQKPKQ